jgi:hypothetical protein
MLTPTTRSYPALLICSIALVFASACEKASPAKPSSTLAISTQPQNQTVAYGATAMLTVNGTGTPPLSYQWYVGQSGDSSKPIQNATAASYTTPALTATASYWVRVSDASGGLNSATATVTVTPANPPTITKQPEDVTISLGDKATLTVEASGTPSPTYQWYELSHDILHVIDGATSPTFVTPAQTDTVVYVVRVTNPGGSVDSRPATVSVATSSARPASWP